MSESNESQSVCRPFLCRNAHSSGAKSENTPYVGYNYDESATAGEFTKGLRLTSIRYPDGRLVHHTYGSSGSDDDNLNRLQAIQDASSSSPGATLAGYTYLGLDRVVIQDLPEPDIQLDLFGGTSGTYAGLDRFDRVIDQRWIDYGSSTDVDRFKYGYDRASNRTWRENTVSKNLSTPVYLDEFYTYDGLHRLKTMDRGELNGTKTGITGTPSREEDWSPDPLGNWFNFVQKTSGTTDLDQSRSVNRVNEITDISETTGPSWVTPAYDRNGNMTTIPNPADPAESFTATYDAWNRLVRIEQEVVGPVTVKIAEYAYDGLMRRTEKATFTAGVLANTRHVYYTSRWQAIEERLDTSTSPDRQFIWGSLYIDHLILRDRDTDANGTLDERLYALQDGNWNVTALAGTGGEVAERCAYSPFGVSELADAQYLGRSSSSYDWNRLFSGHSRDAMGLYVCRRRVLHVYLGWLQRDMIEYRDAFHLYGYGKNSPLVFVDPSGLKLLIYAFEGTRLPGAPRPLRDELLIHTKNILGDEGTRWELSYHEQQVTNPLLGVPRIARKPHDQATTKQIDGCYPRILLVGYSWGAITVLKVLERLTLLTPRVIVDRVFTIDPIQITKLKREPLETKTLDNFCEWDNFFQTLDKNSLRIAFGLIKLRGLEVEGASNTEIVAADFAAQGLDPDTAHAAMPSVEKVKLGYGDVLKAFLFTLGLNRKKCCGSAKQECDVPGC